MREQKAETFDTTSGPVEISLQQLGGIEAGSVIVGLARKHGAAIGRIAAAVTDPTMIGEAIGALTTNLDPAEFEALLLKFTKGGRVTVGEEFLDLDRKQIDVLFRGHTAALFRLMWFALRSNYTDFFSELSALVPKKPSTLKSVQTSP